VTTFTAHNKIGKLRRDYSAKNIACVPAILSVAGGKIHPEFLYFLWLMPDIQTVKFLSSRGYLSSRNSTINNGHLNGKMHTHDYLQANVTTKNNRYKADYVAVGTAFAPAIVSVAGQMHPEFLRLLWVLADKETRNYYALIGAEEEIGSEAFSWSRASTFGFNKNSIGKAIVYATDTRLHLSVHSTAPPSRRQPGQLISSAECLMHGAAHASHHAAPRPAPPHPAINVDEGAPIVAPSAHVNRAGAGEVEVVDDDSHAASGVAASKWLAANLVGDGVAAGGTGAHISANDDA